MALTNAYCTVDELVEWNRSAGSVSPQMLERAISACSRGISNHCRRNFWLSSSTARLFAPDNAIEFDLGAFNDLVTISAVATDGDGDGTFETTWSAADYELLPLNPDSGPEPRPYESIRATGTKVFPFVESTPAATGRSGRVRITATWGWPAVPDPVTQACILHAARIFKRKDSPEGVSGWNEFGAIRVGRTDPDVIGFLEDYRLGRKIGLVRIR